MNPIDWGNSPIAVGLARGVVSAIIAGAIAYFGAQLAGTPEETARLMGYVAGLTPLGALFALGGYDQYRADHGIVISGDVPVASSELRVTKVTTKP